MLYAVGGFVRDSLLNIPSKDLDIVAIVADWQELLALGNKLGEVKEENEEYGRLRVLVPHANLPTFANEWLELNGHLPDVLPVDLLLPRRDINHDGRHCKTEFSTLEEDLARRDFTINAIAMSEDGEIIDLHNGVKDLVGRRLVFVGNPLERIREDYLRVLRLFRFSVTKDFLRDAQANMAIMSNATEIAEGIKQNVSADRIREELKKMFAHNTIEALNALDGLPTKVRNALFQEVKLSPTQRKK